MTLEDKYKEMFSEGKMEGLAEGEAKGRTEGEMKYRPLISNLHHNGLSVAEIAKLAELSEEKVAEVLQAEGSDK